MFVGFKQPVVIRRVSLRAVSIFRPWVELLYTGNAYSAAEK